MSYIKCHIILSPIDSLAGTEYILIIAKKSVKMTLFRQNYKYAQIQSSSKRFQKNKKSSRARRDRKTLHRHQKGFFRSPVDKHLKGKFAYTRNKKGTQLEKTSNA